MRRRCCCSTPVPGDCFDFWDSLGGASDHIGSTATFHWDGLYLKNPGSGSFSGWFISNPNIYPNFSPVLTSGSVELEYIGNISDNCVWHGSYPMSISFPHFTLPDDRLPDGSGQWGSSAPASCTDKKYSKTFSTIGVTASFRLVVPKTYWPWFQGKFILNDHYAGYDPLLGTYANGYGRFDYDKYPIDTADCTATEPAFNDPYPDCTGFDTEENAISYGRVLIGSVNFMAQESGIAGGRGHLDPLSGFVTNIIPPGDIDFPNRKLTVGVGSFGKINRYMCMPDFSCKLTYCRLIDFGWVLDASPETTTFNIGEGYIEW